MTYKTSRFQEGSKMGRYFYETLKEYADSTTIHGISYIFKNGISILDRLIWIAAVVTGIFFAIYLSTYSYVDWQNSPVTTTVLTTAKPIRNISFPAITICAQVQNYSSQVFLKSLKLFFHTLWLTGLNLGLAWLADVCAAKT